MFRDGVAVFRLAEQSVEDQDVESALQEFDARWWSAAHSVEILLYLL